VQSGSFDVKNAYCRTYAILSSAHHAKNGRKNATTAHVTEI